MLSVNAAGALLVVVHNTACTLPPPSTRKLKARPMLRMLVWLKQPINVIKVMLHVGLSA
jgi:hypothetical protein